MLINELLNIIDANLPADTAMKDDRIGLQIQAGRNEVNSFLVALELNQEVLNEAVKLNCDCIITFHPLIYQPLLSILDSDRAGNLCAGLIKNSIALISIHTNFDAFSEGTSKILADLLQLTTISFLKNNDTFQDRGMGVVAVPESPLTADNLLLRIQSVCHAPLRYTPRNDNKLIETIAIVGGSGSSFLQDVLDAKIDAFITADISYHKFHIANGDLLLIDAGHYEMEQFVPIGIAQLLKSKINNSDYNFIRVSQSYTNPVRYFPESEKFIQLQKNYLSNINMAV